MIIPSLNTVYNGYRFRSRLEARWAVFFDAAGIKYQYEPEKLGAHNWDSEEEFVEYIPDFYLPDLDMWVEVKPCKTKLYEAAVKISCCIDYNATPISNGLLVLGQIPAHKEALPSFPCFYWNKGVMVKLTAFLQKYGFGSYMLFDTEMPGNITSAPDLPDLPDFVDEDLIDYNYNPHRFKHIIDTIPWEMAIYEFKSQIEFFNACFDKARQARFEHGEHGAVS